MRTWIILLLALIGGVAVADGNPNALTPEEALLGYESLFNGKDLRNWDGDPALWSVKRGVIVGSTDERPLRENSFMVSKQEYGDFEVRFEVKLRNGNSGMQFRSERFDDWGVRGYQLDFAAGKSWGNLHGEGLPGGLILDGWQDKGEFAVRSEWKSNRSPLRRPAHPDLGQRRGRE